MQRSKITGRFCGRRHSIHQKSKTRQETLLHKPLAGRCTHSIRPPVDQWRDGSKRQLFLSVLEEMDRQLGKLFDNIHNDPALSQNTIILACSDNGPEKGAGVAGPSADTRRICSREESVHLLWLGHPS